MIVLRKDEIIVLLGAGASKDSGIPTSWDMITQIERLIKNNPSWTEFETLYNYIKSAIYYAGGVRGNFESQVPFNIETVVNALTELEKKEEHTIYPFIGNWNIKLVEVAGIDFQKITLFKSKIIKQLKEKWILIPDYRSAAYFNKFGDFHQQFTFPLRIFSLNYDLCIEKNFSEKYIERGFDQKRKWDWRLFEESDSNPINPDIKIILSKMHGSIDWTRDEAGNLTFLDEATQIDDDKLAIIFGTDYKLSYVDPFLFFAYEFRKYSLDAKIIICIGYGFADDHINGMIKQALISDPLKRILCVKPCEGKNQEEQEHISKNILELENCEQIIIENMTAKKYLGTKFTIDALQSLVPESPEEMPF